MDLYYDDPYTILLPPDHRFPGNKFRRVREELVRRDIVRAHDLHVSEPVPVEVVLRAHAPEYVAKVLRGTLDNQAIRSLGFPWSAELVTWALAGVGATLSAARAALSTGFAGNLGGGTHHAATNRCGGFCLFNDLATTSVVLLAEGAVARILVLDLDVHQGDGTAEMLSNEPRAFTCSLHSEWNFPFDKKKSDLDVGLADGTGDAAFLDALKSALPICIERAKPELILYQAGVDALREDRLGRLAMTHAGLRERDRMVLETARRLGVPVALTLGGGYADPIELTVEAHIGTLEVARDVYG